MFNSDIVHTSDHSSFGLSDKITILTFNQTSSSNRMWNTYSFTS